MIISDKALLSGVKAPWGYGLVGRLPELRANEYRLLPAAPFIRLYRWARWTAAPVRSTGAP